jgi:type IV pilus assembly protein PilW
MQKTLPKFQVGVTLIELMVAMTLGLFLLLSVSQMFLATGTSSRVDENSARMQEAGRAGIDLISREVRRAGYIVDPTLTAAGTVFTASAPFDANAAISATAATISIRYQGAGDASTQTCSGATVDALSVGVMTFDVNTPAGTTTPALRCRSITATADVTLPFVPNVEALDVTAGVDTTGDMEPDSYVAPSAVTDWTKVRSVRLQLKVRSEDDNLVDTAQAYRDFDGSLTTPTDRRLRRVYSTVISLRNLVP